jgi:hypothetical protein
VADDVTEVGLGLRPDLTGRGLGGAFLDAGLRFAVETLAQHFTNRALHEFAWMTHAPGT